MLINVMLIKKKTCTTPKLVSSRFGSDFYPFSAVVVVVYIFRHFNHYIFTEINKNNNEEEKSSGTTRTGVSQKGL